MIGQSNMGVLVLVIGQACTGKTWFIKKYLDLVVSGYRNTGIIEDISLGNASLIDIDERDANELLVISAQTYKSFPRALRFRANFIVFTDKMSFCSYFENNPTASGLDATQLQSIAPMKSLFDTGNYKKVVYSRDDASVRLVN
jgi:hypothetical protein